MERRFPLRRNYIGLIFSLAAGLGASALAILGYRDMDFDYSSVADAPLLIFVPLGSLAILALGVFSLYAGIIGVVTQIRYPENELVISDAGICMPGQHGRGRTFYPFAHMRAHKITQAGKLFCVEIMLDTNKQITIVGNLFRSWNDYEETKKLIGARVPCAT